MFAPAAEIPTTAQRLVLAGDATCVGLLRAVELAVQAVAEQEELDGLGPGYLQGSEEHVEEAGVDGAFDGGGRDRSSESLMA
ncbi:hypothetical protein DZF93_00480 [Clavibacter michiganensis subsp. insidiosus]|uniref:Uncharacterized protein n=1 Tax=Clavibacter michiganensis subsp. insidiosus TaxID=33014 RepID=A0A0D5CN86_9MICO|nr:hypothetical protein VO01_16095 [Clavibacter michiganensis subsp. insidiosus]AWF99955.1 hypothetical protein BEH61_15725 [Clavibacter michiganensis subsp. insidiosus]RIJ45051.1 hypothetical protein DZF93_00480 [Clavibacter michiganensis subsp. insidiosus]